MKKIFAVMLSYTYDDYFYNMTKNSINTLKESLKDYETNLIIVETLSDKIFHEKFNSNGYAHLSDENFNVITMFPNPNETKFNYNRSLNHGFNLGLKNSISSDYYLILNNDLIFSSNWFNIIDNIMEQNEAIKSASPFSPKNKEQDTLKDEINFGYRIAYHLVGWCIVIKGEIFRDIFPFDEQFEFWYQDNDYAKRLEKYGYKHAMIKTSLVKHLFAESNKLFPKEDWENATKGSLKKFLDKWR